MKFIFYLLLFVPSFIFAQDDLEDIFDDGVANKDIQVIIGTDLLTTIGGTANLYTQVNLFQRAGVHIGGGVIPFSYLVDAGDVISLAEPNELFEKKVNFGTFYNWGFRYLTNTNWGSIVPYYYFDFKRWKYKIKGVSGIDYYRRKGNIGSGTIITLNNNIGFDAHFGIFVGRTWREVGDNNQMNVDIRTGFDIGFTVFYQF